MQIPVRWEFVVAGPGETVVPAAPETGLAGAASAFFGASFCRLARS